MSTGLVCPHCGHLNTRAGVFCAQCGGKMGNPEVRPDGPRPANKILTAFRWLVGIALAVLIGLMAWPQDVPHVLPDRNTGLAVTEQLYRLRHAGERGETAAEVFRQSDINAYLSWVLSEAPGSGSANRLTLEIQRLHLTVDSPSCTFRILGALGPVRLSFAVQGAPSASESGGRLTPEAAWIGHLPIPSPAIPWVFDKLSVLFAEMDDVQAVWSTLSTVQTRTGLVRLGMGSAESP